MRKGVRAVLALWALTAAFIAVPVHAAESVDYLELIYDNTEEIKEDTDEIIDELQRYNPKVTVLYSVNNAIPQCYYRPALAELPNIGARVAKEGGFAAVYSGFFDLDNSEGYKPKGTQDRALEVLGYDFLLSKEHYDGGVYTAVLSENNVAYGTAIMDIYKAMGKDIISIKIFFKADNTVTMETSPVAEALPSYIHELDTSQARAEVYVSRTDPERYYEKALRDMAAYADSENSTITNGEFIILLADMMHFYGEPVLSEAEMNMLLQVYGSEVPTYLTAREQDAYLYLKSRGVLNIDLDYRANLQLEDMLEILMCVKDEGSRTNFKEIAVTASIGDELINHGYYPRQVEIAEGEDAVELDTEHLYSDVTAYDYLIEVDSISEFRSPLNGEAADNIFVAKIPGKPAQGALAGTKYMGRVAGEDGTQYYHFIIPIMPNNSAYMKIAAVSYKKGYIQINSKEGDDVPAYIWVEQGGGIYRASKLKGKDGLTADRIPFKPGQFEGFVDKDRKESNRTTADTGFLSQLLSFLAPIKVKASDFSSATGAYQNNTAMTMLTIYHAENLIGWGDKSQPPSFTKQIPGFEVVSYSEKELAVRLPLVYEDYFLSNLERDPKKTATRYQAVATMTGSTLIRYSDLVDAGLFVNDSTELLPTPESYSDGQLLILNSAYGQVKVNNETREVVVGTTVYKVKNDGSLLFTNVMENGEYVLYVDFRVAYGWASHIIDMAVTGTGDSYAINIHTRSSSRRTRAVQVVQVKPPASFTAGRSYEVAEVIPKGIASAGDVAGGDVPKLLTTGSYALASWVIYQRADAATGTSRDYLFVFYPEYAYKGWKEKNKPNDIEKMRDIVGYTVQADGWLCRVVELNGSVTDKPGGITYSEQFGYLYNLPDWEDYTVKKYLKGEYLLPLSSYEGANGNYVIDANVNCFKGYRYGTRPGVGVKSVDIKNEATEGTSPTRVEVYAAPAGVSAFYGGGRRRYYQVSSEVLQQQIASTGDASSTFYFGTSVCSLTGEESKGYKVELAYSGDYAKTVGMDIDRAGKFYLIQVRASPLSFTVGNTLKLGYKWCMYNSSLSTEASDVEEDEEVYLIEEEDVAQEEAFDGFGELSLSRVIEWIDFGASYVIVFVFTIFPIVGITAMTLLVGLAFISDSKIFNLFAEKIFDPVKILTLGKRDMQDFKLMDCIWSLIIGYTIFGLMYNGNLLRVIQWLLTILGMFTERIKLM